MYATAKRLDFPHWEAGGLNVTVFDPKKRCSIGLAFDSFSFSQDSGDVAQENEYVKKMCDVLPSALQITHFRRLGLRRWYVKSVDMDFEDLTSILAIKLFGNQESLRRIFSGEWKDLMHVSIMEDKECQVRTQIGPVRRTEIPSLIPIDTQHHLEKERAQADMVAINADYPPVGLYAEMDCFVFNADNRITLEDANSFYSKAEAKIESMTLELNDYIFSNKVR